MPPMEKFGNRTSHRAGGGVHHAHGMRHSVPTGPAETTICASTRGSHHRREGPGQGGHVVALHQLLLQRLGRREAAAQGRRQPRPPRPPPRRLRPAGGGRSPAAGGGPLRWGGRWRSPSGDMG